MTILIFTKNKEISRLQSQGSMFNPMQPNITKMPDQAIDFILTYMHTYTLTSSIVPAWLKKMIMPLILERCIQNTLHTLRYFRVKKSTTVIHTYHYHSLGHACLRLPCPSPNTQHHHPPPTNPSAPSTHCTLAHPRLLSPLPTTLRFGHANTLPWHLLCCNDPPHLCPI